MWHDQKLTPAEKIQKLGEEVPDRPVEMQSVTDEIFKTKNIVMPSSEDLNAKFKYFLTMMYAAEHAQKRVLETSFKGQAETINLLHNSKYGTGVHEKYHRISKHDIQEMIKDMGWNQPQPSTSKRPRERSSESEEDSVQVSGLDSGEESEADRNARKTKEKRKTQKRKPRNKVTLGRESTTRSASVHCVIELLRT